MPSEIKKFNPENIGPENLFRPPTAVVHDELKYLITQVDLALRGEKKHKRLLQVGTELEMFFFSPDMDPVDAEAQYGESDQNPNYDPWHRRKIEELEKFGTSLLKNPHRFMFTSDLGRIFLEFRTAPQSAKEYLKTIEMFGNRLRRQCERLRVWPVVHSQHIHVSLVDRRNATTIIPSDKPVKSWFSKVSPLVLLPEEWGSRDYRPHWVRSNGIKPNGVNDLSHPEFRMLSSEYANDPVLNLLLSLKTMYEGCLGKGGITPHVYGREYQQSAIEMGNDPDLIDFFGQSTLATLARITSQYPAVSRREITIDQVR